LTPALSRCTPSALLAFLPRAFEVLNVLSNFIDPLVNCELARLSLHKQVGLLGSHHLELVFPDFLDLADLLQLDSAFMLNFALFFMIVIKSSFRHKHEQPLLLHPIPILFREKPLKQLVPLRDLAISRVDPRPLQVNLQFRFQFYGRSEFGQFFVHSFNGWVDGDWLLV